MTTSIKMHVRMSLQQILHTNVCMYVCLHAYKRIYVCMSACIQTYLCMYVCIQAYLSFQQYHHSCTRTHVFAFCTHCTYACIHTPLKKSHLSRLRAQPSRRLHTPKKMQRPLVKSNLNMWKITKKNGRIYVHICTCVHTYTANKIHAHVHTCVHIYTHTYLCTHNVANRMTAYGNTKKNHSKLST